MIRGTQREMIMLKGDKSSAFECVFFLLRRDLASPKQKPDDMLAEANRIISQNRSSSDRRSVLLWRAAKQKTPAFLIGALCGALLALAILLL